MSTPTRRRRNSYGAAAAWAAASALLAVLGLAVLAPVASQPAKPPPDLSLVIWRYHFPGELEYFSELVTSYEKAYGQAVHLYTYEWAACPARLKQWTAEYRAYAPDMVVVRDTDLPAIVGYASSLEERLPPSFLKEFYPGLLAQCRTEGVLVAMPWKVWPQALYYRADLFREKGLLPPKSPEEMLEAARKVARPPEVMGLGLPGRADGGAAEAFLTTFRAQGGVLFNSEGRLAIGEEPGRRALQWWSDAVQAHVTQPEVLSWTDAELPALFVGGRLAMLIERPWLLREIGLAPPPFEVGVVPVPKAPEGMDSSRTDCLVVFDTTADINGCCRFLQYALRHEAQGALARLGVPSVRRDAADDLPRDDPRWAAFRKALQTGRGMPPEAWGTIADLTNRLLFYVLSGRATVDEAINGIDVDLVGEPDGARLGLPPPGPREDARPREKAEPDAKGKT